jgi:zinc protease
MKARWWALLWLLSGLCAGCGGVKPPTPPRRTVLELPIEELLIKNNGLRVVVIPDPGASRIQVTMTYQVGTIDEPVGQEGIAHLAEHLLFLPTIGETRETLFARLEAITPWFHGSTELETTTYASQADPRRLLDVLQLEALRLASGCRTLTEEEFVRERDVVRNELRQRAAALAIRRAVHEALYPESHAYRRTAVSDEAVVGRISRDQACAFIDAHYSPDNAVLIVSGNVAREPLTDALRRSLGRVSKRPIAARPRVAKLVPRPPATTVVPSEAPRAIIAWPLPDDPVARAQTRAIATMMQLHISQEIKGEIAVVELGAAGAPAIGFVISPGPDESVADAVGAAERTARAMAEQLRFSMFEAARARTGHALFARFEDGLERDRLLADDVFAGRDPKQRLNAEIRALNQLVLADAFAIVEDRFAFAKATRVTLMPGTRGRPPVIARRATAAPPVTLDPQLHRPGEPRPGADPAAAHVEAKRTSDRDPLAGIRERTLANGLRLVLMPLSGVPTVDARLVFPVGAVDEPEQQRGVAYLAAQALMPRVEDGGVYAFRTVSGQYAVRVDAESTTFRVQGLDQHIDVLLVGLERLVREGVYTDRRHQEIVRRATQKLGDKDALSELWSAALHGPEHPYTRVESWRRARFDTLDLAALRKFQSTHFRPGGATLIIAGSFDPAVANGWVDYLFADWKGASPGLRVADRTSLRPAALARYDDGASQVAVTIALPIRGTHAARRIAAEMIGAAIADARTQLGASYGLHATLIEERLTTYIQISGAVAAERAQEVLALVRDRLARLAATDAAAASLFVAARRNVMARLASFTGGASALASLAEANIEQRLPLNARIQIAEDARRLTLDAMWHALDSIDLAAAAILLVGPRDAVTRSFTALGRTPRVLPP